MPAIVGPGKYHGGTVRPPQERGRRRQAAIVKAASELIDTHGWRSAEVTIQAIALASGTSPATIYHYFPDIESVFAAVAVTYVEEMVEATSTVPSTSDKLDDIDAAIAANIEQRRAYFAHSPGLREMWFDLRASPRVTLIHDHYLNLVAEQVRRSSPLRVAASRDHLDYQIFVQITRALWGLAFQLDSEGHPTVVTEIHNLTRRLYRLPLQDN